MYWSQRTWSELPSDLAAAQHAAILPVGATEQHGPHLGCGVDAVLADKLCSVVSQRTRVPMLPTLPYGCSIGHSQRWPGTIGVLPTTLIGLVTEIGDWAFIGGVRRLFIVNTHVTNAAPLRCALEMVRTALIPQAGDPDRTAGLVFAHPVNRTSTNGVTGTPSAASAVDGEQAFAWMVEDLSALI